MNVPPIWQPPQLSRLTGEGPPPVTWTASANAPARRPRPRRAKPPLRAPPSPRATSPRAEPPPAALAHRAARRRLGPRTPPSVPRRAAPDRHLESPTPPLRPSNMPFRGAGPPLVSNSPPRALKHPQTGTSLSPYRASSLALPGKVPKTERGTPSRLTGEGPPETAPKTTPYRGRP